MSEEQIVKDKRNFEKISGQYCNEGMMWSLHYIGQDSNNNVALIGTASHCSHEIYIKGDYRCKILCIEVTLPDGEKFCDTHESIHLSDICPNCEKPRRTKDD